MSSTGDEDSKVFSQDGNHRSAPVSEDDEVKGTIAHSEDQSSSDEEERYGRFYGPDSSWRFYTKEERAVAASLDQAENNNLSHHLYNVHAWKQRLYDRQTVLDTRPWHSKQRWIRPDDNGKIPWNPHPRLTTWPLRPIDVPRRREEWGIPTVYPHEDPGTYAKSECWKPSMDLQEELKATFLLQAKERFRQREWAANASGSEASRTTSATRSRRSSVSSNEEEEEEDNDAAHDLKLLEAQLQGSYRERSLKPNSHVDTNFPTFMEDDDKAGTLLQPTIRHIMAKQDDLLAGLHHSRRGHRKDSRGKRRKSRPDSRSRSSARGAIKVSTKRKRVASDAVQDDDDSIPAFGANDDDSSDEAAKGPENPTPSCRRRKLGTRDWSEVLGIAAIVGWDQAIIDRAARRCAATFGEGMMMRIMPETSVDGKRDRVVEYMPEMVPDLHIPSEIEKETSEESNKPVEFPCPHTSCARCDEPYSKRWRLREHLKRKHKHTDDEIDAMEPEMSGRADDPMLMDTNAAISEEEAEAVEATDPHGNREDTQSNLGAPSDTAAVRKDGFLQPVDIFIGRSKNKRPRSASSKSDSRKVSKSRGRRGRSRNSVHSAASADDEL